MVWRRDLTQGKLGAHLHMGSQTVFFWKACLAKEVLQKIPSDFEVE